MKKVVNCGKTTSITTTAALTLGIIAAVLLTAGFANVGGGMFSTVVVQTAAAQVQQEENVDQPITQDADQDQTLENNQPIAQDADQDQLLENNQDNDLQNDQDTIQFLDQGESNSGGGDGPTTFGDDVGFLNADQTNDQDASNNNEQNPVQTSNQDATANNEQNPVQTSDQDATATNTDQCVQEEPSLDVTGGGPTSAAFFGGSNNCFNAEDNDSVTDSPF